MKRKLKFSGRFALTSVAAAALLLASPVVSALGLGRLNVQSSLGEVLRAEIDITSMTAEEQANLRIRVAPPESYRAANVDYNPILPGTRATLEKRADGRLFVRLISDRGVQEPFVDVILEISWATGRLVREYTLLFDPPTAVRAAAPTAPAGTTTSPVMSAAPTQPMPLPTATTRATAAASAREAREAARAEARERRAAARSAAATAPRTADETAPAARAAGAGAGVDEYRVRAGDSLSKIAGRTQRSGVSLDQMLVSLFRANPDAFVGSNMNRLKAGAVLSVPSAEVAQGVSGGEARQTIQAQSADFGAYRQRLASGALTPRPDASPRQSGGKVQASVDDKKQSAAPTPDKLTLSKGSAASAAAGGEAKLSAERERQAAAARVAELNKNLDQLKRMQGTATSPSTSPPPVTGTPPVAAGGRPASAAVTPPVVVAAAPAVLPRPGAAVTPAPTAATPAPVVPPAPAPSPAPAPAPVVATPTPSASPAPVAAASVPAIAVAPVVVAAASTPSPTPPAAA
ncbi:MAG: FimV/HubP family polar landmark protein, partial [Caldimonas sp.]